ncbi:hypothetical protein H6G81_31780 [Scytonema hofmannii FACHB-248]|uniref:Uncharacterized protein n=2 Tax=Nostocales TaxID=1161 RepID=A0ABR8H0L5_9CYAN|nr:hypothetical protein [Scytonema hofmannii]MBD2608978.1 hypothetical protein [Scytonema hofmannii FACHB-248]
MGIITTYFDLMSPHAIALSPDAIELDRDPIALSPDAIELDRDPIELSPDAIE